MYVYEDAKWEETLELVDSTSEYVQGAVLVKTVIIEVATVKLQSCR
jgi:1-pyrroline-5-carboxylate dehydrogenase